MLKIKELERIRNNYETKMTEYGLSYLDYDGYWKVITSTGKIRLLHHVVYEKEIGKIPDGFVVHHRDYDPSNNSCDNLIAMSKSEHCRLHSCDYWNGVFKANKFRIENFESIV